MESKQEFTTEGVTVKAVDAPGGFLVAARTVAAENPTSQMEGPTMAALQPANMAVPAQASTGELKKKRGRPRKYGPDGTVAAALSPMPISASIPLPGDFPGWKQHTTTTTRVKPFPTIKKAHRTIKKAHRLESESIGDRLAFLVGGNFMPHVITVNAGEDVAMKVLSLSQQEARAICVLSASGSIANVTLRQPSSSGGTLTYEGRFEILSLSGSFMPTDNGILKSRSGGMSVSLAGPDGRVLGGGLAGLLIAATPVQVVLGSFLPGHQLEQKPKKTRTEPVSAPVPPLVSPLNREATEGGYEGPKLNFSSPPSNHTDPLASLYSGEDSKDVETDNNLSSSSPEGESNEDSPSKFDVSG